MKIARFHHKQQSSAHARLGVVLTNGMIGDLRPGYAHLLAREHGDLQADDVAALRIPSELARLLAGGPAARAALAEGARHLAALAAQRDATARQAGGLFT